MNLKKSSKEEYFSQTEKNILDDICPLTFAQQRLWFLDQLEPNSSFYNISIALYLQGSLNFPALERSLNEIVRRHEVFRTRFIYDGGQPYQVISTNLQFTVPIIDLSELQEKNIREIQIRHLIDQEARCPFSLSKGPLFRTHLLKAAINEHVLLITIHHIISDGWSMNLFRQELTSLYNAYTQGQSSPLPELPIQYGDYAVWQQERFQGEVLERQLTYWKHQLGKELPVLQLPNDYSRPAVQSYKGANQPLLITAELTHALKKLSNRESVTLFMTLLAAFQTLLYRYSGQEDLLIGTPIAGRNQIEVENLIGIFLNILVLRTNLAGNPSFKNLLQRVREVTLQAYTHQDLPFEKLVKELQPERDLSRNPLFQVMMILQNPMGSDLNLTGLNVSFLPVENKHATFDLTLNLIETNEEISGWVEYNTDLFKSSTIKRMIGHFLKLLQSIVDNPDEKIIKLPIMSLQEHRQLLEDWNNTDSDFSNDQPIHQLFEEQVMRTPDIIAVSFGEDQISYSELNQRANQLANYLNAQGVGAEAVVGVCLDRSIEFIIVILGVLKIGGAYLPLDSNYPPERLLFMLQDAAVSLLLTKSSTSVIFGNFHGKIIRLDEEWKNIKKLGMQEVQSNVKPTNLANIIYTSGSTGLPKGVATIHKQLQNRFEWMWQAYPFKEDEVCCQKTAVSFVDSTWEIFGPLLKGVRLVIIPDISVKDPVALIQTLLTYEITRLIVVPSLLDLMLDNLADSVNLKKLKIIVSSGEALKSSLAAQFKEKFKNTLLLNLYGSSEVSADVTCYEVNPQTEYFTVFIPIGRPIANSQIYILDKHLEPIPIGVTGELYVSGTGLARGYNNRPDSTAERFIPNPFINLQGRIMYRTGDLGRYLPDGTIEYIGRTDNQIKLRGYRIELGEIEITLKKHSAVKQAVVVLREDISKDKRLIAYLTLTKPTSVSQLAFNQHQLLNDLRSYLRSKLPDYMIPTNFVELEFLPLTPNGKVDHKALPKPDFNEFNTKKKIYPRTRTEKLLAEIWGELLSLETEKIGINDKFFDLGGHSILVVSLVSQLKMAFPMDNLPISLLFEISTIEELGSLIDLHYNPKF